MVAEMGITPMAGWWGAGKEPGSQGGLVWCKLWLGGSLEATGGFWFNLLGGYFFYYDIISSLEKSCKNSTVKSLIPFTEIHQQFAFYSFERLCVCARAHAHPQTF